MSTNGKHRQAGILTGKERPDYGVVAMLENQERTIVVCREFFGVTSPALMAMAWYCDRHGMFVTCLSTPNTILADLKGRVVRDRPQHQRQAIEANLLSLIDRVDLLHPAKRP